MSLTELAEFANFLVFMGGILVILMFFGALADTAGGGECPKWPMYLMLFGLVLIVAGLVILFGWVPAGYRNPPM